MTIDDPPVFIQQFNWNISLRSCCGYGEARLHVFNDLKRRAANGSRFDSGCALASEGRHFWFLRFACSRAIRARLTVISSRGLFSNGWRWLAISKQLDEIRSPGFIDQGRIAAKSSQQR